MLHSIKQLNLDEKELNKLSKNVIDFYENTSNYDFDLKVKWNPLFKVFGILLKILFSNRIEQLNIPMSNNKESTALKSEIIHLVNEKSKEVKRTIWLRTFKKSEQVVYSGIYETCTIPNGQNCIKAIFPLPNGSATVILNPTVTEKGELIFNTYYSERGVKEFAEFLDRNRESLIADVIYFEGEKDGIPVEVAMTYNTSYTGI